MTQPTSYKMISPINKLGMDDFNNIVNKLFCFRYKDECIASDLAIVSKDIHSYTKMYLNTNYRNYKLAITFEKLSMNWQIERTRRWESNVLKSLCNKLFTPVNQLDMGLDFHSLEAFNNSIQWGVNYHYDAEWLDAVDPIINNVELTVDEDLFVVYWIQEFREIWLPNTINDVIY